MRFGFWEVLLLQFIVYFALWLIDDYIAMLLSLILGGVCLAIWILSWIVEWISPSRVPKAYFSWLLASALAPFLSLLTYLLVFDGQLNWMQ